MLDERGDITSRKHGGNVASTLANARVRKGTDNAKVLAFWKRRFQATSADYEAFSGNPKNQFSGRITFLLKNGFLEDTGRLAADGCRLLRITQKGLTA